MKRIKNGIFSLLILIILIGCKDNVFVIPTQTTPLEWEENDVLYNTYFYEKVKSKAFFPTDSTIIIDKTGTKAYFKIKYENGCVPHDIKLIIPSQTIKNQQFDLPWMIYHEHIYTTCAVDIIARYTFDLSSVSTTRDWRANPPTIVNTSQTDNPALVVFLEVAL